MEIIKLFRRVTVDRDCYNVMKAVIKQFSLDGLFPFKDILLDLQVPKTSDYGDTLFYLTPIECSKRCSQTVVIANAECYFRGDSNRDVETIVKHFSIKSTSSSQVSKTTKMLYEQIEVWRNRKLGEYSFIVLYARY